MEERGQVSKLEKDHDRSFMSLLLLTNEANKSSTYKYKYRVYCIYTPSGRNYFPMVICYINVVYLISIINIY
jgi:hypothetical protein